MGNLLVYGLEGMRTSKETMSYWAAL